MLVAVGVISNESGSWEMAVDVDAVEVPPTISSPLANRLRWIAGCTRLVNVRPTAAYDEHALYDR